MTGPAKDRSRLRRLWDHANYKAEQWRAVFWTRFLSDMAFVHINKTGGSSIEAALGIPFQHRTALQLRDLMGRHRYERVFSFAFVRNPWDKVASHYRYRMKTNQTRLGRRPIPFNEWVVRAYGDRDPEYFDQPMMFMPQADWITDERGEVMVDFVGRFERLHEDFEEVCRKLGRQASLPHLKSSGRGSDYRDSYEPAARRVVEERFRRDLELFGYRFDE